MDNKDMSYLWDMLDAAKAIEEFIHDRSIRDYQTNRMLRNAVERNIEIIGEAANRVSTEFMEMYNEIPWTKIIAQRNVIAHEYGEIKHELLWKVASVYISELIEKLEEVMPKSL